MKNNYILRLIGLIVIFAQMLISCETAENITSCYKFKNKKNNKNYTANLEKHFSKQKALKNKDETNKIFNNNYNRVNTHQMDVIMESPLIASTENGIIIYNDNYLSKTKNSGMVYKNDYSNENLIQNKRVLKNFKKSKNEIIDNSDASSSSKSQLVALILVLFVGALGIHRFYLGHIGIGIIQLLTLGGCGIWSFVDLILIITGDLKPKNGEYSETL